MTHPVPTEGREGRKLPDCMNESALIRCRRCCEELESLDGAEGCEDPQCWAQMPGARSADR